MGLSAFRTAALLSISGVSGVAWAEPSDSGVISGRVFRADGRPASKARVRSVRRWRALENWRSPGDLCPDTLVACATRETLEHLASLGESGPEALFEAATLTRSDGRFELKGVPSGTSWLWAEVDSEAVAIEVVDVEPNRETRAVLRCPDGRVQTGRAQTSTAGPIRGAFVFAIETRIGQILRTTTDEDGRFAFEHLSPEAVYQLVLRGSGQLLGSQADSSFDSELLVEPRDSILGRITKGGHPAANANVWIDWMDFGVKLGSVRRIELQTDSEGRFRIAGALRGYAQFTAFDQERCGHETFAIRPGAASPVVLELSEPITPVRVTVTDSIGQTLEGVGLSSFSSGYRGPAGRRGANRDSPTKGEGPPQTYQREWTLRGGASGGRVRGSGLENGVAPAQPGTSYDGRLRNPRAHHQFEYLEQVRAFRALYAFASAAFRAGKTSVAFPPWSFRPTTYVRQGLIAT
ncbi:MAG: hypothetical protein HY791_33970 [Deltaproteobacteria bacterium]|nr:hypothetical protein [Deltaproteobacteria bacterium]